MAAMPAVANPNPDRARRGARVVSTGEAKAEDVPEPLLPMGAPAAAPIVPSAAPAAAVARTPAGNLSESAILRLMV